MLSIAKDYNENHCWICYDQGHALLIFLYPNKLQELYVSDKCFLNHFQSYLWVELRLKS